MLTYIILYFVAGIIFASFMVGVEAPRTVNERLNRMREPAGSTQIRFIGRILVWPYVLVRVLGMLFGKFLR